MSLITLLWLQTLYSSDSHSVFIVSQVGLQQIYKCSWLYAVRIKFAFTLSSGNRLICKSMKQTSGFGLTKGLCQIARLTLLTPSIPTLKIPYKRYCCQLLLLVAIEPILIYVLDGVYIHKCLQLSIISVN